MSPDTIAVGVFTIAGTLLGVIVGALTERLVRVTGRLRFECSSSSLRPDVGSAHGGPLSMDWTEVNKEMSVQGAQYIFAIDLFNGKEVPTGLRGVRVRLIPRRRRVFRKPTACAASAKCDAGGGGDQHSASPVRTPRITWQPSCRSGRSHQGQEVAEGRVRGRVP